MRFDLRHRFALATAVALAFPAMAQADSNPKDIGLAQQAIVNLNIAILWQEGGRKGIDAAKLPAGVKPKALLAYKAEMDKATPTMQAKLAATEAAHFTSAQIADIEKLSEVPSYQAVMESALLGKPTPEVSAMPKADQDVIGALGEKDYVKKFLDEVLNDKAATATIRKLARKSVMASMK